MLCTAAAPYLGSDHTGARGRTRKWITRAPRSCAARAVKSALALEELQLHRRQRNLHNSQPTVFLHDTVQATTQAANSWVDMYSSAKDSHLAFGDSAPGAAGAPQARPDGTALRSAVNCNGFTKEPNMATVAYKMRDMIVAQNDITSNVRNALTTAPLKVGHTPGEIVDPERDSRPAHAEMFLTEGTSHTLMRHLEGDAHEAVIQRDLTYALLDAYHVPPGKFGLNRNTERMAGNLLISQQPIETYDLFIKKLIEYVNAVLEAAGSKLRYTQTISRAELDAIGGLLTVKAAKRLYSRAFRISEEDLDETKIIELSMQNPEKHVKKSADQLAAERLKAK